jgi:hypothetical protein
MRQRKETAYPQMGAFVQLRPGGHHMPSVPHAPRMTHQTPRVKVSAGYLVAGPHDTT